MKTKSGLTTKTEKREAKTGLKTIHSPRLWADVVKSGLIAGLALLLMANFSFAATNDLSSALQRGLFEEEANHNLEAAIKSYQSVATQFDKDRKLAGTAIFRLGECYRKLGKTNEANAQYERILKEFSEDEKLANLSHQYLSTTSWAPPQNPDPEKIRNEVKADVAAGKYNEALAKLVWYFQNAIKLNSSLTGVRLSSGLSDWVALGSVYPSALEKLRSMRDEIAKNFHEGEAWRDPFPPFMDFSGINRALVEDEKTKDLFLWLDANKPTAAKTVFHVVEPVLIQAKEYKLCGKYIDSRSLDSILENYKFTKKHSLTSKYGKQFDEINEKSFIHKTVTTVALLVLNERKAEADQLATEALKESENPEFKMQVEQALQGQFPPELNYNPSLIRKTPQKATRKVDDPGSK